MHANVKRLYCAFCRVLFCITCSSTRSDKWSDWFLKKKIYIITLSDCGHLQQTYLLTYMHLASLTCLVTLLEIIFWKTIEFVITLFWLSSGDLKWDTLEETFIFRNTFMLYRNEFVQLQQMLQRWYLIFAREKILLQVLHFKALFMMQNPLFCPMIWSLINVLP